MNEQNSLALSQKRLENIKFVADTFGLDEKHLKSFIAENKLDSRQLYDFLTKRYYISDTSDYEDFDKLINSLDRDKVQSTMFYIQNVDINNNPLTDSQKYIHAQRLILDFIVNEKSTLPELIISQKNYHIDKIANKLSEIAAQESRKTAENAIYNINNGTNLPTQLDFTNEIAELAKLAKSSDINYVLAANVAMSKGNNNYSRPEDIDIWAKKILAQNLSGMENVIEHENLLNFSGLSMMLEQPTELIDQLVKFQMEHYPVTLDDRYILTHNEERQNVHLNYVAMDLFDVDLADNPKFVPELDVDEVAVVIIDNAANDYLKDGGRIFTFDTIEEAEAYKAENGLDKHGIWDIENGDFIRDENSELITFNTQQEANNYISQNLILIEPTQDQEVHEDDIVTSENDIANLKAAIVHSLTREEEKALYHGESHERSETLETVANRAGATMNMTKETIDATIQDIKSELNLTRLYGAHQPLQNQNIQAQNKSIDKSLEIQEKLDKLDEILNKVEQEEYNDTPKHSQYATNDEIDITPELQAALNVLNDITPESTEQENRAFCTEMGITLEEYHSVMDEGSDYFRQINEQEMENYFEAWENVDYAPPITVEGKQDVRDFYNLAEEYRIDTSIADSQIENTLYLKEVINEQQALINGLYKQINELKADMESNFSQIAEVLLDDSAKNLQNEVSGIKAYTWELRDTLVEACGTSKTQIEKAYEGLHQVADNFVNNLKHHKNILQDNINKTFHITLPYKAMEKCNNIMINTCNKALDKIEAVSNASRQAGTGIRNIGRAIIGRPPLETNQEIGNIAQALKTPFQAIREGCTRSKEKCANHLKKYEKIEERADKSREKLIQNKITKAIDKGKSADKINGLQEKMKDAAVRSKKNEKLRSNTDKSREQTKQKPKRDER